MSEEFEDILDDYQRKLHKTQTCYELVICNNPNCPHHGDKYSCSRSVPHPCTMHCSSDCVGHPGSECVPLNEIKE
jgi:hypothetical protein